MALLAPLCAEESDHNKWWPSVKCFDYNNIYFSLDGGFATPVVFGGGDKLTGVGGGFGIESGLDMNGWLFGLRYEFIAYSDNGGLMESFKHNMISLSASKLFTARLLRFLPTWMDLRAQIALGVDIARANYYVNEDAKDDGVKFSKTDAGFVYCFGVFAEHNDIPYVVPYLGAYFNFTHDKGGLYFMPVITAGVRTSIGKIKKGRL